MFMFSTQLPLRIGANVNKLVLARISRVNNMRTVHREYYLKCYEMEKREGIGRGSLAEPNEGKKKCIFLTFHFLSAFFTEVF